MFVKMHVISATNFVRTRGLWRRWKKMEAIHVLTVSFPAAIRAVASETNSSGVRWARVSLSEAFMR